jgi:hypothetical protein
MGYQPSLEPPPKKSKPSTPDTAVNSSDATTTGTSNMMSANGILLTRVLLGCSGNRKYSVYLKESSDFTDWPQGVCGNLMAASRASSTWDRYRAAIRSFEKFSEL